MYVEPCNDLFNDSKLKDRWSNMYVQAVVGLGLGDPTQG